MLPSLALALAVM
ncbi:UNVERIFIED_CONTAM: hypothetical protein GTU68_062035 [Idotea baltica]|nr:hypothetical protein [Idotea baltica]